MFDLSNFPHISIILSDSLHIYLFNIYIYTYIYIYTHIKKNPKTHIHSYTEKKMTVREIRNPITQRIKYQKQTRGKVDSGKNTLRKREAWPS